MGKYPQAFIISLLLGLFLSFSAKAITLSNEAKIYLVTCGPNQTELYSAFGHTAIRVADPVLRTDVIFNYGVFDFNQPNFYLNFAKGNLLYKLAVADYDRFLLSYTREGRYVYLQELNLNAAERQVLFDLLIENARPENRDYYYDYFYDNCATRPRDIMQLAAEAMGGKIQWDTTYAVEPMSIRDLCETYLYFQPWGDLGIDLCLGLPMDKKADALDYTFLPDYMMQATRGAYFVRPGEQKPLVLNTEQIAKEAFTAERPLFTPQLAFSLLLVLGVLLSFIEWRTGRSMLWFDKILFTLVGLIGWLLLILWLATDHAAAARNMNLLWAIPFYFPFVLFLRKKGGGFGLFIMRLSFLLQLITLIGWFFWPQDLHPGLLPLCALLMWRSFWRVYSANKAAELPQTAD
jgi:hypothetical protein